MDEEKKELTPKELASLAGQVAEMIQKKIKGSEARTVLQVAVNLLLGPHNKIIDEGYINSPTLTR